MVWKKTTQCINQLLDHNVFWKTLEENKGVSITFSTQLFAVGWFFFEAEGCTRAPLVRVCVLMSPLLEILLFSARYRKVSRQNLTLVAHYSLNIQSSSSIKGILYKDDTEIRRVLVCPNGKIPMPPTATLITTDDATTKLFRVSTISMTSQQWWQWYNGWNGFNCIIGGLRVFRQLHSANLRWRGKQQRTTALKITLRRGAGFTSLFLDS